MLDIDPSRGPYAGASTPLRSFPEVYDYEAGRRTLWAMPPHEFLLGIDGEGQPVTAGLKSDSPHFLISAASGAGKSVTARNIATQGLLKGYDVVFLDYKRHSHRWAKNLPGVLYASSFQEIGNVLVTLGAMLHHRNKIVEEWPGDIDSAPVGNRVLIIFEEMNGAMEQLAAMDKTLAKGEYTCMQAFADIMFLGRAAQMHVGAIGQYMDKSVMKTAIRENFGIRLLIQHTWEAWNMLVPRASRTGGAPAAPTEDGRGYVVLRGKPRETQLLYLTEEECAQIARDAYAARERAGLVQPHTRRSQRKLDRGIKRALAALDRGIG